MKPKTHRIGLMVRFLPRDHAALKVAARAYRSPSLNWFITEMIECMLNPARWGEFQARMNSGTQQLTLELAANAKQSNPSPSKPRKGAKATPRHARPA